MSRRVGTNLLTFLVVVIVHTAAVGHMVREEKIQPCTLREIDVYYYDWDILARSRLSEGDVRKNYYVKFSVADAGLVSTLLSEITKLKHSRLNDDKKVSIDTRLVIDERLCGRTVRTMVASKFHLLDEKKSLKYELDDEFRDRFRFLKR